MWGWIIFGVLVAVVTVVGLYSALVVASLEDDRAEEYYRKQQKEEKK
jgi:hypothetical protein